MKPTRAVYSNDRKAPRMRKGKFSKSVVTKDLYKRFIKNFPEYKEMTWREFYDNWCDIAQSVRYHAIYNPLGVKLGSYLGEIKLQYLPHKFEVINHHISEIEGEKITDTQLEHKGKAATIKWERRWAVKFNKILQFYAFDETRDINALARKYLLDSNNIPKMRTSRNTLGGVSVWRQKLNK